MPSIVHHQGEKYEVFISFRGSDFRHRFLSHLFAALGRKQIHTFIDDDLQRGEDIRESLFQIIEESYISIVIFSTNYPKSRWCLAELEKVHESMKLRKHIVVPIFYEADPSDVRNNRGNYAIDLQKWKHALVEISNLSGFVSKQFSNDAKLIDAIVNDVSMKLSDMCASNLHNIGLFGIDSRIKDVESLLGIDSMNDARLIGIWGMGGIGKTTIAGKVFDRISKNFDGYCFVSNIGETLSLKCDPKDLRDKIICELLGDKDVKMHSSRSIHDSIRKRLKRTRALIVLDDVHTCMQLKSLLEYGGLCPDTFCPGSRIIVTSRDWQVLDDVNIKSDIYQAKELEDNEALQLFSWHAFGQNKPKEEYEKSSKEVVKYSHGVPLALVVLGSELKNKPSAYWEDALGKFNNTSPLEIQKILRISFHGLDWNEKNIFLDIACFLKGSSRTYVENVLKAFGFHASIGISRLIDKSLIIEEGENFTMHDLLQQMGQEIVIE